MNCEQHFKCLYFNFQFILMLNSVPWQTAEELEHVV